MQASSSAWDVAGSAGWRALRAHLAGQDIPASPGELASLLHQAFRELADIDLAGGPAAPVYLEQYAHGGMSSGMISLEAWRQRLMPMLVERARTRLPGWPPTTDPDHLHAEHGQRPVQGAWSLSR